LEIDWETPARLDAYHIINAPHSMPPPVQGTLRTCLKAYKRWPSDAVPIIHTDAPVLGKTAFDGPEIVELVRQLPSEELG
jgi:hypothetical protein